MPPRPKISIAQLKALFRRVAKDKEFVGITREGAEQVLRHEPPVEKTITTLMEKVPIEGVTQPVEQLQSPDLFRLQPRQMLYDEAFEKYVNNPRAYGKPSGFGYEPPVDHLYAPGVGSPEEMAEGLAYERIRTKPFQLPEGMRKNISAMQKQMQNEAAEASLAAEGLTPQDIRMETKEYLKSKGEKLMKTDMEDLVEKGLIAEALWLSGAEDQRTAMSRLWRRIYDKQKAVVKTSYKNPKEYFIYCLRQFEKNPKQLRQKRPDEYELIVRMYERLEKGPPE